MEGEHRGPRWACKWVFFSKKALISGKLVYNHAFFVCSQLVEKGRNPKIYI